MKPFGGVAENSAWLRFQPEWLTFRPRFSNVYPPERVLVYRRASAAEWLFILAACLAAWLTVFAMPRNQKQLYVLAGVDFSRVSSWALAVSLSQEP